ncbi:MAG: hypothetical protein KGO96_10135 [Elusimicrobia bacterium]|nr:hypothetical protein [Elusimicrobiota bacterium]
MTDRSEWVEKARAVIRAAFPPKERPTIDELEQILADGDPPSEMLETGEVALIADGLAAAYAEGRKEGLTEGRADEAVEVAQLRRDIELLRSKPALVAGTTPRPWYVDRCDQDDGTINYEIWSVFTAADGSTDMHRVAVINDDDNEHAKADAELIVDAVNRLSVSTTIGP